MGPEAAGARNRPTFGADKHRPMDGLRGEVDPFLLRPNPAVLTFPMFHPLTPGSSLPRHRQPPRSRQHAASSDTAGETRRREPQTLCATIEPCSEERVKIRKSWRTAPRSSLGRLVPRAASARQPRGHLPLQHLLARRGHPRSLCRSSPNAPAASSTSDKRSRGRSATSRPIQLRLAGRHTVDHTVTLIQGNGTLTNNDDCIIGFNRQ